MTGGTTQHQFIIEHDILKALVGLLDVVGLYILFNAKRLITIVGDIEIKIIAIGLGWAGAELLTSNFMDIIFQGWANEMKTEYLVSAVAANFDILEIISLASLAYILTNKKDDSGMKKLVIYFLILARYLFPVALRYVKETSTVGATETSDNREFMLLGIKAAFSLFFFTTSKMLL